MKILSLHLFTLSLGYFLTSANSFAASASSAGGYSVGIMLGMVNSSQTDMNTLITRANTRDGGISTSALNQAYEGSLFIMKRFNGTIFAMQLRPSFFYQQQSGTGTGGTYKYGLNGYTVFPILRLYPLENDFMKFYMQFGLGYGQSYGTIEEGAARVKFSGGGFGTMMGLGAEFCFSPSHCINLEGNYRYLGYDRSIVTESNGTFAADSLTQYGKGQELEKDNNDVSTRMGGLVFQAGYTIWF